MLGMVLIYAVLQSPTYAVTITACMVVIALILMLSFTHYMRSTDTNVITKDIDSKYNIIVKDSVVYLSEKEINK